MAAPGTDLELLQAWRGGDSTAGNELFDRHFDRLYRFFAYKLPDQAEDLVQQTLLSCVRSQESFRGEAAFGTYLYRIARNKLYDALQVRGREQPFDPMQVAVADLAESPSRLLARDQDQQLLVHSLRRLPVQLQVLVELRFFEQLRGPQLAEVLDLPEGTVRSRLRRALKLLKEAAEAITASPSEVEATMTRLQTWADGVRESAGQDIATK